MENKIDIVLLRWGKTSAKDDKKPQTVLTYGMPAESTDKSKGLLIVTDWLPVKVFDYLSEDYLLKPLTATFEYVMTYRGLAKVALTGIFDQDGTCIVDQADLKG